MSKKKAFSIIIILLFVISLSLTVLISQQQQKTEQHAAEATTQIMVTDSASGIIIPPSLAGLGFEPAEICNIISLDKQGPVLANLFSNLGNAVMRFGGDAVENTTWSPLGTSSCSYNNIIITQSLVTDLFNYAKKINWKVIWGENLKNGNVGGDTDESAYVVSNAGSNLLALEIGNEPDLYGISYSTFKTNWETFAAAIKAKTPSAPLSGPASGYQVSWTNDFVNDNQLDILDYNLLIGCFGSKAITSSCLNKTASDITDNGTVDGADYNLFLRELSVQKEV